MLLMIDNYDSFTYNLVQYFQELGQKIRVVRNDAISVTEIGQIAPSAIVISPGPSSPNEAGISLSVLERFAGRIPILGVCLGHQCIGQSFGAKIVHAKHVMHGKTSLIRHTGAGMFRGVPDPFIVARYHSLVIDRTSLPDCLEQTAWTEDGQVMGVRHKTLPIEGVQFHPEAIQTRHGRRLLANFISEHSEVTTAGKTTALTWS